MSDIQLKLGRGASDISSVEALCAWHTLWPTRFETKSIGLLRLGVDCFSQHMCIYIYIHIYVCMYIYIYIYKNLDMVGSSIRHAHAAIIHYDDHNDGEKSGMGGRSR